MLFSLSFSNKASFFSVRPRARPIFLPNYVCSSLVFPVQVPLFGYTVPFFWAPGWRTSFFFPLRHAFNSLLFDNFYRSCDLFSSCRFRLCSILIMAFFVDKSPRFGCPSLGRKFLYLRSFEVAMSFLSSPLVPFFREVILPFRIKQFSQSSFFKDNLDNFPGLKGSLFLWSTFFRASFC